MFKVLILLACDPRTYEVRLVMIRLATERSDSCRQLRKKRVFVLGGVHGPYIRRLSRVGVLYRVRMLVFAGHVYWLHLSLCQQV